MDGWREGLLLCVSFILLNTPELIILLRGKQELIFNSYFNRVGCKDFCCYFSTIFIPSCRIHRTTES